MIRFSAVLLGMIVGFGLTGFASADEKKTDEFPKLIVAKWEITKAGGGAPVGTKLEFTKDKTVILTIKMNDKDLEAKGTFKIEKDKLTVKMSFAGQDMEEVLTIKKLTDDAMELEDKDGGIDVLKKTK